MSYGVPRVSPSSVVAGGTASSVQKVANVVALVDIGIDQPRSIDGDFNVVTVDKNGKVVEGVTLAPDRVHLRLDLLDAPGARTVFVSPKTVGMPPFPYRVVAIEVEPQSVMITGKGERLLASTAVSTEPIELNERTRSFSQRVKLIPPEGCSVSGAGSVLVNVRIEKPSDEDPDSQ